MVGGRNGRQLLAENIDALALLLNSHSNEVTEKLSSILEILTLSCLSWNRAYNGRLRCLNCDLPNDRLHSKIENELN